jgi:hypothetical protein
MNAVLCLLGLRALSCATAPLAPPVSAYSRRRVCGALPSRGLRRFLADEGVNHLRLGLVSSGVNITQHKSLAGKIAGAGDPLLRELRRDIV